ncbi:hypothetical protein BZG36_00004 [Bifiguratus adelaidae]|uniref:Cyclic nucleotide-binding domain-containing protein n=1 Tax=Bifiguratus adelaidae TaxID=1938954 RepID=A0A261Y8A4_9FUNG|nr:hypothetical protein BZG36_00004 [Bifiguratus adelaidae]
MIHASVSQKEAYDLYGSSPRSGRYLLFENDHAGESPVSVTPSSLVRQRTLALANVGLAQGTGTSTSSGVQIPFSRSFPTDPTTTSSTKITQSNLSTLLKSPPQCSIPALEAQRTNHAYGDDRGQQPCCLWDSRELSERSPLLSKHYVGSSYQAHQNTSPSPISSRLGSPVGANVVDESQLSNPDNEQFGQKKTNQIAADSAQVHLPASGPEYHVTPDQRSLRDKRKPVFSSLPSPVPAHHRSSNGHQYHWLRSKFCKLGKRELCKELVIQPLVHIPAVFLGVLLNLLDAVSYGLITFPLSNPIFADFGPDGISMFFVSTIISQLTYTCGGSVFAGATGSMMIEIIPFLHIMAETITATVGEDHAHSVISTTVVAFSLSSIMTGIAFWILGAFKLGSLLEFFPRHILVGCIGGVGWFLIATAIEVSSSLPHPIAYSMEDFRYLFTNQHHFALWITPLAAACLLRILNTHIKSPLFVPFFFCFIPFAFYAVAIGVFGIGIDNLRKDGWVFSLPGVELPFWHYFTYFDFQAIHWQALWRTIPAMLALTFFGILHVPINIPALGVSLQQDHLDVNRELIAHGVSNALSGLLGSVQNYLVYSNSLLFIRCGGNTRLAGFMLAVATAALWVTGPWVVGYIPVMVVGALIFHLGIDLCKEALYDTIGSVSWAEYGTIWSIVVLMTWWGFVEGIFAGIVIACVVFVVHSSRRTVVQGVYTGQQARSNVRRPDRQHRFLERIGSQILLVRLQGHVFFGTIGAVESCVREQLNIEGPERMLLRFCCLDMAAVAQGLDYSAAMGFVRIKRMLNQKGVYLVLCGVGDEGSETARALQRVGVWPVESVEEGSTMVRLFQRANEGLEWCENVLLGGFYEQLGNGSIVQDLTVIDSSHTSLVGTSSPRNQHLAEAVTLLLQDPKIPANPGNVAQPTSLLLQALYSSAESPTRDNSSTNQEQRSQYDICFALASYFTCQTVDAASVIWSEGEEASFIVLAGTGVLRALGSSGDGFSKSRPDSTTFLPGTFLGGLDVLLNRPRSSSVISDPVGAQSCTFWRLSTADFWALVSGEREGACVGRRLCRAILRDAVGIGSQE